MSCDYCGLPTPDGGALHPICATEVSTEPLRHCDLDCCNPTDEEN